MCSTTTTTTTTTTKIKTTKTNNYKNATTTNTNKNQNNQKQQNQQQMILPTTLQQLQKDHHQKQENDKMTQPTNITFQPPPPPPVSLQQWQLWQTPWQSHVTCDNVKYEQCSLTLTMNLHFRSLLACGLSGRLWALRARLLCPTRPLVSQAVWPTQMYPWETRGKPW